MMNSREGFAGPINLGNSDEFTMNELAEILLEMTGSKSKIVRLPLPADDPVRRKPLIDLAKKELGWTPIVPLRIGLGKTVDYFRQLINGETI